MYSHTFSQRILLVELAEFPSIPLKATQSFPTAGIADAPSTVPGTAWTLKNIC